MSYLGWKLGGRISEMFLLCILYIAIYLFLFNRRSINSKLIHSSSTIIQYLQTKIFTSCDLLKLVSYSNYKQTYFHSSAIQTVCKYPTQTVAYHMIYGLVVGFFSEIYNLLQCLNLEVQTFGTDMCLKDQHVLPSISQNM